MIPPEAVWFLVKQIFTELKEKNQLTYFHRTETSHGMVTALQEVILELRRGAVTSSDIRADTFITPKKSDDLKLLLAAYENSG